MPAPLTPRHLGRECVNVSISRVCWAGAVTEVRSAFGWKKVKRYQPTDGPTDGPTERVTYRVACTQLKTLEITKL